MNDIIDAATYRSMAKDLTYQDDFIDNQLAYLDKRKATAAPLVTEREASRAMWDTWYMTDIVGPDIYAAALQDLGYKPGIITYQLAYLDKKKTPPPVDGDGTLPAERDLLQSEALTAFKDQPDRRDRA